MKISAISTTGYSSRTVRGKGLIIAMIIWFLISFSFIGISLINIIKGQENESWPSVDGIILFSDIDRSSGSEGGSTYGAKITYKYNLNGINYTSDAISCGYAYSSDYSAAYQLVENYPVGKTVKIYYNPNNPPEAVLIKGIDIASWIFFSAGLFFSMIGIVLVTYFRFKKNGRKSSKQININLEKTNFFPGDTIEGAVNLSLKKQRYAKALKVALIVDAGFETFSRGETVYNSCNIYKDEIILDVEREYFNESYPFRIKMPIDIFQKLEKLAAESAIVMQKKYLDWAVNKGYGNYIEKNKWYVKASLDMPKKLDISSKLEINVSNVQ